MYKIGIGYDVHSLEIGKPFILGGIKLNHSKGSVGHSDADVLIHAICDAILGALNLRDIGFHFPDNEKKYIGSVENWDKAEQAIINAAKDRGFRVINTKLNQAPFYFSKLIEFEKNK